MSSFRRFGVNLTAFNLLNYLARNADNVIVGRALGAQALGYYGTAYRSLLLPVQASAGIAGRVLFPVLSRLQSSPLMAREAFQSTVGLITFGTYPLMMLVLVAADWVVEVVLGAKWLPMTPVLRILTVVGMSQSLVNLEGNIYMAKNRTDLMFRVGSVIAVFYVASFFLGVRWGIIGVASCYAAMDVLVTIPALHFSLGLIGMRPYELLAGVARTAFCSLLMGAGVWMIRVPLTIYTHGLGRLAAAGLIALASYVFWSWLLNRQQFRDVLDVVCSAVRTRPSER